MSNTPKKPGDNDSASEALAEDATTSLHEQVFGSDPDGFVNDTPPGAIGENVNYGFGGVQLDRNQPLRHIGDTDQGDFQPGGGRRR
jgi:hypothetical protein